MQLPRAILAALAAVVLLLVLTACSSGEPAPAAEVETVAAPTTTDPAVSADAPYTPPDPSGVTDEASLRRAFEAANPGRDWETFRADMLPMCELDELTATRGFLALADTGQLGKIEAAIRGLCPELVPHLEAARRVIAEE